MNDQLDPNETKEEGADDAVIGVAFKYSFLVIVLLAFVIGIVWFSMRADTPIEEVIERSTIEAPKELDQVRSEMPHVPFQEMEPLGFTHFNGARGEKLLPETMGAGVAVFDYDGDGVQDLFFANGIPWPHDKSSEKPTQTLYRNDGNGNFSDVTRAAGLDKRFFGQGVAVGDIDNDGDADLFVSALGENHLYLNQNGVFTDVTKAYGASGDEHAWSSGAGFFDYDNDGDLDLFVCNYVVWSRKLDRDQNFTLNGTDRAYGPPTSYGGTDSYLYRNDGGKFSDVSAEAGVHVANPATGNAMGKSLAVTFADIDGDRYLDILVANDTVQNFVFKNLGDGRFEEIGTEAGLAFDSMGSATGAMGMDAADVANDGRLAVGIANFANESTSLYVQQPGDQWMFADMANRQGIGSPSRLKLSFSLFFFDYDLDGRLDMLQANGHLEDEINAIQPSQHYRQAAQLFWNTGVGKSRFVAVPGDKLGELGRPIVGRGGAFGDFDGDGDLDIVLTQVAGPPLLVRNGQAQDNHWLRLNLVGTASNRDAIGAIAILENDGHVQRHVVMPTRGYLSSVERILTFGLGKNTSVAKLTIQWPDGSDQVVSVNGIDSLLEIVQP